MASPGPSTAVRVLVVDDHALFADTLRLFLARDARIEVVGTAATGQEAIDLTLASHPDVVLMDVFMRGMDGLEATKRLRDASPATHVIVLSGLAGDDIGTEARAAGALGHLEKGNVHASLVDAVLRAADGQPLA